MKKTALLMAMIMLVSLFSLTAFAAEITQDSTPKTGTLTVSATKDVAYTLSIPSGSKSLNLAVDTAQEIGKIGLTACAIEADSEVKVTVQSAANPDFKLVNGGSFLPYTLSATTWKLKVVAPLEAINLTLGSRAGATAAGTYADTLTFTAVYGKSVV